MKKTIYWLAGNGVTHYYLDKNEAIKNFDIVSRHGLYVVLYSLETEFNNEILGLLLNRSLNHCQIPRYDKAKMLKQNVSIE